MMQSIIGGALLRESEVSRLSLFLAHTSSGSQQDCVLLGREDVVRKVW